MPLAVHGSTGWVTASSGKGRRFSIGDIAFAFGDCVRALQVTAMGGKQPQAILQSPSAIVRSGIVGALAMIAEVEPFAFFVRVPAQGKS